MPGHHSRRFYFLLFGALYFVQGVVTSDQLNFCKPHMASAGIDADTDTEHIPVDAMTFGGEAILCVLQEWGRS